MSNYDGQMYSFETAFRPQEHELSLEVGRNEPASGLGSGAIVDFGADRVICRESRDLAE